MKDNNLMISGSRRNGVLILFGVNVLLFGAAAAAADTAASSSASASASASTEQSQEAAQTDAPGGTQDLDEVVISADKKHQLDLLQSVDDKPQSISIVSGEELANLDAFDVSDILQRTANAHWNFGTPRTGTISLRGISALAGTNQQPSVGTTVDGVSYADTALFSIQDFTDVDSLQVIRGPTGTDGGKNSNLGALVINNRTPSFDADLESALTLGTQGTLKGEAAGGGSIVDGLLAWRASFYTDKQTGAYPNAYNRDASYLNTDRTAGRAQFLLTPTENFSVLAGYYYQPSSHEYVNGLSFNERSPATYADGTAVNAANAAVTKLGRSWFTQEANYNVADYLESVVDNDTGGPVVFNTKDEWAILNYKFDAGTLKLISAYDAYTQQAENDDGTPFSITTMGGNILQYHQNSEELRFNSTTGGLFDYTTGLYYLRSKLLALGRTQYGSDAGAWYANVTQYQTLDANGDGQALLSQALNHLQVINNANYQYQTEAYFGHLAWNLSSKFTLSGGIRVTREQRTDVQSNLVADEGDGAALNPVANDNVALGGFATTAAGALTAADSTAQLLTADAVAHQIFGAAITATPGAAYNSLTTKQQAQVAAAQAVRAQQLTGLYTQVTAQPFRQTIPTWELSPIFKIDDQKSLYLTWQHGEKPGISQIVGGTANGGNTELVKAETSNSFETGFKSLLLNRNLALNADVFYDIIRNYQQSVYFYDDYLTKLLNNGTLQYLSGTGSAPKVITRGVETDAAFYGIPHTAIRVAASYADARYRATTLLGQPIESSDSKTPYFDANGRTLPNSPKWTGNIAVEYRYPVLTLTNLREFHSTLNYVYTSSYNADPSLSSYYVVPSYGLMDLSIGLGRSDGRFEVSLIAKNLFNTQYRYQGWTTWIPSAPRWEGLQLKYKML